jgi:hypothetical protein
MTDKIVMRTAKAKKTIAGFKRLADEMEGLLEELEDNLDSINIQIVKENATGHRITLTIDKPERNDDGETGEETNTTTGV